jgi:hypothetical protein
MGKLLWVISSEFLHLHQNLQFSIHANPVSPGRSPRIEHYVWGGAVRQGAVWKSEGFGVKERMGKK